MLKKISVLAFAGLLALPAVASAGAGGAASNLDAQIADLTRQLEALKAQMGQMKKDQDANNAKVASFDERAENWDLASRIQLSGDFRSRVDYYRANTEAYMPFFVPAGTPGSTAVAALTPFGYASNTGGYQAPAAVYDNKSMFTNRFRLDMRAKALENVEFKGRLAMYKAWGMQSTPGTDGLGSPLGGMPLFDGNTTRTPNDSALYVDRAFVNWNNIGGSPIWFSIGRRPTTDGPPNQLRMGMDERMATPTAYMDWPFDGISVGYAYQSLFGMTDAPGRVRICYGRGFEAGLQQKDTGINDTDFIGVSWDIYKKGSRFFYLQSFVAMDVFNFPAFSDANTNAFYSAALGGRKNVGNVYHTSGVYEDKFQNLNYFISGAWSRAEPNDATGMFNDPMSPTLNTHTEDGYAVHLGARYDFANTPFKLGAEYNHGSKYWIAMTPGHDDLYESKLATRGNVYEVYGIYDIPGGEKISKFGKAFIRLGYQHYDYDYTGSGDWNMMPVDIDQTSTALLMSAPIKKADQVYMTFEAAF